jgi:hypothetical protein
MQIINSSFCVVLMTCLILWPFQLRNTSIYVLAYLVWLLASWQWAPLITSNYYSDLTHDYTCTCSCQRMIATSVCRLSCSQPQWTIESNVHHRRLTRGERAYALTSHHHQRATQIRAKWSTEDYTTRPNRGEKALPDLEDRAGLAFCCAYQCARSRPRWHAHLISSWSGHPSSWRALRAGAVTGGRGTPPNFSTYVSWWLLTLTPSGLSSGASVRAATNAI